jgi:phage virion morphogenesis protein
MRYVVTENGRVVVGISAPLERLRERLPATLKEMGASLLALVKAGMEKERSPDGVPWPQLKPSTVRQRRRMGRGPHPMLRLHGDLFRSLHAEAGRDSVYVATNWPYAAAHQFGARIRHKAGTTTLYFARKKNGQVGNRFVRKNRSDFAQDAQVGAHETVIPARPYLFTAAGHVPEPWVDRMTIILLRRMGVKGGA